MKINRRNPLTSLKHECLKRKCIEAEIGKVRLNIEYNNGEVSRNNTDTVTQYRACTRTSL